MKKVLLIAITFLCLFSSFFSVNVYQYLSDLEMESTLCTDIYLDVDHSMNTSREDALKGIVDIANKYGVAISRKVYDTTDITGNYGYVETYYTSAVQGDSFYNDFPLETGRYLSSDDSNNVFLSSTEESNNNQIGKITRFDSKNKIYIRPFFAQENLPLSAEYEINTQDSSIISAMVDDFKEVVPDVKIIDDSANTINGLDSYFVIYFSILLFSIFILVLLVYLYYIISRYKEFAVCKLFGYSNRNIIKNTMIKSSFFFLIAESINIFCTFLFLGIYNHFADFVDFLIFWGSIQVVILLSLLFIFFLIALLIKRVRTPNMLKNSKPIRSISCLNMITKFVFVVITCSVLLNCVQNINTVILQNNDMNRWQQVSDYVYTAYQPSVPITGDGARMDDESKITSALDDKKLKDFYAQTSQDGVLVKPSDYYKYFDSQDYGNIPDYDPNKKSIMINSNYLQLNPIYDENNNIVTINNENSAVTVLLVPEKYKPYEQAIKQLYEQDRTWHYHIEEDWYLEMLGQDLGYSGAQNAYQKYGMMDVEIQYVKNEQEYFLYRPMTLLSNEPNAIVDPIAVVVNNDNCGWDEYASIISSGEYFLPVSDINEPKRCFVNELTATDTTSNLNFYSLYRCVDHYMNSIYQQLMIDFIIIFVSIIVLIAIATITVSNYMVSNRMTNVVKKLHGYSFVGKYWKLLSTIPVFWLLSFCFMFLLSKIHLFGSLSILRMSLFALGMMIIDLFISILLIQIQERKTTTKILKGE